jgi:hypothetical protein
MNERKARRSVSVFQTHNGCPCRPLSLRLSFFFIRDAEKLCAQRWVPMRNIEGDSSRKLLKPKLKRLLRMLRIKRRGQTWYVLTCFARLTSELVIQSVGPVARGPRLNDRLPDDSLADSISPVFSGMKHSRNTRVSDNGPRTASLMTMTLDYI